MWCGWMCGDARTAQVVPSINMYAYLFLCTRHPAVDWFSIQHSLDRRLLAPAIQQQLIMPRWTGSLFSSALTERSSLLPFGSSWILRSPECWWKKRAGGRCRVERARRWQRQRGEVPPLPVRILQKEQLRHYTLRSDPVPGASMLDFWELQSSAPAELAPAHPHTNGYVCG